jgi:hypothetical protein
MQQQIQQGDVTVEYIKAMPRGGKTLTPTDRGYVVAEGEHTGHAHVVEVEGVLEMREVDGVIYARIEAPVSFTHDEHHPITLAPGVVKFGRVQEYDHFAEEARQVQD